MCMAFFPDGISQSMQSKRESILWNIDDDSLIISVDYDDVMPLNQAHL